MSYNVGMTDITLVLPFALPPPELAPDLVRALQAPGLAALLSRTSSDRPTVADPDARALPHELWLGREVGLSDGRKLSFAAAAMHGFGLDPADGAWMIVHPAHIEISRTFLMMGDMRRLGLVESHSRALFDSAKPYFDDCGLALLYGDAHTWFMRADAWTALDTASPDAAGGMNLTDWLPLGERALDYRKLQNEVQMLWHQHPANVEREARGWPVINSFWPWGGADAGDVPSRAFACTGSPPWLSAMARQHGPLADLLGSAEPLLYCDGRLAEAALATDWAGWLQHMRQLDQDTFTPLLDAVKTGRLGKARLVLSHRNALAEFTTTSMAQRKFWRQPTLDRLLP
jgi:hypothetical protein